MRDEFALISKLLKDWQLRSEVKIGPGDDASAIEIPEAEDNLVLQSTDLLIENVHFRKDWGTPFQLGWKSLAVSLSDLAAMGGNPHHTHLNLAIPPTWTESEILEFMSGFKALAERYNVSLLGGDLSASPEHLMISVHIDGAVSKNNVIRRQGAQAGDIIWVSGKLGIAAAGMECLKKDRVTDCPVELLEAFNQPEPEVELGLLCASSGHVHAMIDISDGLAGDLGHILKASKVGATLIEEQIPTIEDIVKLPDVINGDPLHLALAGGEDYRLLGCTPEEKINALQKLVEDQLKRSLFPIGIIEERLGLRLQFSDGNHREIEPSAYDHFSSDRT